MVAQALDRPRDCWLHSNRDVCPHNFLFFPFYSFLHTLAFGFLPKTSLRMRLLSLQIPNMPLQYLADGIIEASSRLRFRPNK